MSETQRIQTVEQTSARPSLPAPSSMLARWKADIEAEAKTLGVDAEKLWALIKEHM